MPKKIDLTGMKFRKLRVLKDTEKRGNYRQSIWLCRYECGGIVEVRSDSLKSGNTTSCGKCSVNTYFERDGFMVGLTRKGEEFYYDKADFELIKPYSWHMKNDYPSGCINGKIKKIHQLLMPLVKEVDHINGIKHDNMRKNLRTVNHTQNMMNQAKRKTLTSSKYKGVSWHKQTRKWRAGISFYQKRIDLGYYNTEEEAALIYNKAASFYFGEYARLNVIQSRPVYHAGLPHAHEKELLDSLI